MQVALRVKVRKDVVSDIDSLCQGALGEHVVYRGVLAGQERCCLQRRGTETSSMMAREDREDRGRELYGELVVFVVFDTDILSRRSPKRVIVVELSTAERVSERGIGFDGRTRERTGNLCRRPNA